MPAICDECRKEKSYEDVITLKCNLGYEHNICKKCMIAIKEKASYVNEVE